MPAPIKIDIWSDIACPWCYIGKRNLEAGLAQFRAGNPNVGVEIEYHSFELSPDTPVEFEGSEVDFLVKHKGISEAQVSVMLERVTSIAKSVGLDYDFDALQHTNTLKAHQLLHYAKAHGAQLEAKERLLRAYFIDGRHIGRDDDLADLAAEIGLDRDDALRSLREGEYGDAVRADIEQAVAYGIRGVPFFVFDEHYAMSGAQPPEAFAQALAQAAGDRHDLEVVGDAGAVVCTDETCDVPAVSKG